MARPLKYKTEEELEERCISYIEYLNKKIEDTIAPLGVEVSDIPTKSGLRIWLGISKPVYNDYKKRFPNPIKRVEDIIEDCWVQVLKGNSVTGAIFYLKNAFSEDYRDRTDQNVNVNISGVEITLRKDGQKS